MVPREFRSCRRLRPKRPMASFYDTAPTRFGIGPSFRGRTLPAEGFPPPPVPESAPPSGFVSPLAGTARLPESASPSNSFTIGLTGNFRPRISLCASISLSGLVSLLCLCFLLCLPCPARHPGPHGNHGGSGKNALCRYLLPQNASVLHNHAHSSGKLRRQQQPLHGCGEHFGPTALCGGFDEAHLLIDFVSVAHLFFIPEPEMCLILRDGYSCEYSQSWLRCQSGCGKHRRTGVGSGHRCYTSKL